MYTCIHSPFPLTKWWFLLIKYYLRQTLANVDRAEETACSTTLNNFLPPRSVAVSKLHWMKNFWGSDFFFSVCELLGPVGPRNISQTFPNRPKLVEDDFVYVDLFKYLWWHAETDDHLKVLHKIDNSIKCVVNELSPWRQLKKNMPPMLMTFIHLHVNCRHIESVIESSQSMVVLWFVLVVHHLYMIFYLIHVIS